MTSTLDRLQASGVEVSAEQVQNLRAQYNLDKPMYMQYVHWIGGFLTGDMGYSYLYARPVNELVWERMGYTLIITFAALIFVWVVAIPLGIYTAVRQYSFGDYNLTSAGLIGLATPPFLLGLILMYVGYEWFGVSIGGLFSPEYREAPWSWLRFKDFLSHLWIPMIVLGLGGTAAQMRIMRANLLDELKKPYVVTARAKGVKPFKLIMKYPVRIAINPFVSSLGLQIPFLISGEAIVGMVLNLPTTGPMLFQALLNQDMYLAGSFLMLLSILTVLAMLASDLILAVVDPRIKYE